MPLSSISVESILRAGGSVNVSSSNYVSATLAQFARIAAGIGVSLTINVDNNLSSTSMVSIARAGAGRVTFILH